jgi:hypothetical protein
VAGGPAPYNKRNPAERARLAGIVFDLVLDGCSMRRIDELSRDPDGPTGGQRISATSAKEMVQEERARLLDPKVDEYRAIELARLERSLERLLNMEASVKRAMARKHITVNNGRVIKTTNPETLAEEDVEDDTFILQAVDRLNRIEESRRRVGEAIRRLLGLDMPVKVDATVTEVTQQDVELQEMLRDAKVKMQLEEQQIIDGGADD